MNSKGKRKEVQVSENIVVVYMGASFASVRIFLFSLINDFREHSSSRSGSYFVRPAWPGNHRLGISCKLIICQEGQFGAGFLPLSLTHSPLVL